MIKSMSTITLNKNEYKILKSQAEAYHMLASVFGSSAIEEPIETVVEDFRKTGKYSKAFLTDLKDGLHDLRNSKAWKSK